MKTCTDDLGAIEALRYCESSTRIKNRPHCIVLGEDGSLTVVERTAFMVGVIETMWPEDEYQQMIALQRLKYG